MNYSDFRFTLDIQIHQAQVSVPVTFGDSARRLCIGLTDGRKPYVIEEGCIAVFNAKKPDGTKLKNACIIERNVICYEFTEQTTNCEGIVYCDITLYGADGKVLTSPQFTIVVDKRVVFDEEMPLSADQCTEWNAILTGEAQRQVAENQRLVAEGSTDPESEYYGGRAKAEADRTSTFETKMSEWRQAYTAAEASRDETFGKEEYNRQLEFNTSEKYRDETFEASETQRASLFAENESYRQATFEGNEQARQSTFEENENVRIENDIARGERIAEIEALVGDIDTALDAILANQNKLIGGGA